MKKIVLTFLLLLSLALPITAAVDGKFKYSYPEIKDLPYDLGYQYSRYDLGIEPNTGYELMTLKQPVTLTYHILSEADKTVEVVFDPSYMEIVDIVIPEKVTDPLGNEYTVTAIGKMAFDDCPEIRSVIMPNSITRIEDYAFNMCENKVLHKIGYIKFSENLTHIGNFAFKNCHNLTTGYFKEGNQWKLKQLDFLQDPDIPVYGFGGRLTGTDDYLLLPASVEYIGKHAFEGCYFEREDNELRYGICKVKIPNPSCVIDDYAFAGCELLELITIGEGLNYDGLKNPTPQTDKKGRIGEHAFANCNLMRLDIPSSIESIGENAFINCFKREMVKTPKSQTGRVYYKNLFWYYPRSLFNNEDGLGGKWNDWNNWYSGTGDSSMPADISVLENLLNQWHTNTVTIHSNQTVIGNSAFANNPQLKTVIVTGNAGEFCSGVFRNCTNLESIELPADLAVISRSMFMNDSALVKIKIPQNVTEIGDSAFYQCRKLGKIELPSRLEKVNPYTFYGCKLLDIKELPNGVSSIGNHAFYGCKLISSFTIPDNVTSIGDYAFAECYQHVFLRIGDVRNWYYGLEKVTIGKGVETIGAHAFDGCRHLGTIEMGTNVTTIGDYAFQNCMSCPEDGCEVANNELTLPNSLTVMGTGAFQGCIHLPSITLGEKMTVLPDFAFAYCSDLQSVGNIDNITSANKNAFLGCCSLEYFGSIFDSGGDLILGEDGILYNKDRTEVVSALPNIQDAIISEGVLKIRDGAFADCVVLQYVEFPSTLEEIGSRAFENCIGLTWADLINVKMGEFVYAGCLGIESVIISKDFTQDLQDNWFAGCLNMSAISVEDGNSIYSSDEDETLLLSKDGTTLLRAPSGVDYLNIPESVETIGDYACSNCILLESVSIPASVTHIGAHAFDGCYYVEDWYGYEEYYGLTSIFIENPAVTIGEYAFNNCKALVYVEWTGDVESGALGSIGAYAFNNCESLTPRSSNFYFNISDASVSTLESYAFAGFPGLEEITLPATLKTIGDHAFDSCGNLTSVVFPSGLKKIGSSAFKSSGLTSLKLPDSIEEIGDSAFMDCSKVMALTLSSGLKEIKPYTFYGCFSGGLFDKEPVENFKLSVEIPDGVESIGDYAFYGCAVNTRRYYGHHPKDIYINYYYYYNYGLASLTIGKGVRSIGAHAFDGCYHLVNVNMGEAVTSIGDYAFNNCFKDTFLGVRDVEVTTTDYFVNKEGLTAYPAKWQLHDYAPQPISLPEGLSSLGEYAFSGCAQLPGINFPASLETIPYMAFNGCSNLPKIELSEGLKSIGDYAFADCKGVKEISIPASLDNASRSFVDCESAFTVTYPAEKPKAFDEGFFSSKVYVSKEAVLKAPNAPIEDLKGINPWALFYRIEAKNDTLLHLERVLEEKNGLRFRVLSNKPHPYCEVAGPAKAATDPTTYVVPDYVEYKDETSIYNGIQYKVIRIGNDAFENDLTLVGITIPEGVIDIGQEAFSGCKNLPEITLPNTITNIGERAFNQCYGLTYFEVPPLVTKLNAEVLKDCRGLNTIRMHDNITELGVGALMDCRHLRAFERSENWKLRVIDDYALKNCIELENIKIPEGVEKIGKEAMYYCQKLNTTSLPESLLEIGENAFNYCEVLTTIKVYTETIPKIIGEATLTEPHCKIYVQAKCLDDYKDLWKVHAHRIEPGIIVAQPTRAEMPRYIPGTTYKLIEDRPLGGQKMTWSSTNEVVATVHENHDGTMTLNGVGHTPIRVLTDQKFYHDVTLDVYPQLADANWDGKFTIGDAVNIANYVVWNQSVLSNWWETERMDFKNEDDWTEFYNVGADVNSDGHISVSDASAAVKIILEKNPGSRAGEESADENADALLIEELGVESTDVKKMAFRLANTKEYVALEANIFVPAGATLEEVKAGPRASRHALSTRRIDDRTIRVVLFDLGNKAFAESGEPLLELTVKGKSVDAGQIVITDIIASDLSSRSYRLNSRTVDAEGSDTWMPGGIETVSDDAGFTVSTTTDGIIVGEAAGKEVRVFTVGGCMVKTVTAGSDSQFIGLPRGLYIVTVNTGAVKVAVN